MIYFICRHQGTIDWVKSRKNIKIDVFLDHLDFRETEICAEDTVIGILPIDIAAQICEKGAKFYALKIHQELSERGQNFSADNLEKMNVSLRRFQIIDLEEEL
ncbi:MAG: CRISPR-associated protein Csx16 [Cardiobacteriaceae bacterium]|nr:CRISPR-associated protein Csx16 [Cardiobacteriaceae bacterium]